MGCLPFIRRLLPDQEMCSSFLPGCFLISQKGIPALRQEASPGSGDRFKLFDRILLKEPKRDSCSPPGGFSRIRRWVQALGQVTS
jgi:hypothetical protein